jgi:hypothetical protein
MFNEESIKKYWVYILPCLILIGGGLLHMWRGYYGSGLYPIHADGVDDAYITYRYGWNLANHGTLSWNESGYRRTEGFTNPLWLLFSFGWSLPGVKEWVYPLSVISSLILSCGLLILLINSVYQKHGQSGAAVMGLVLLTVIPAIWLHVTSGLESVVFGIGLALLAYLVIFNDSRKFHPIVIVLLTIFIGLLRSDGFVYLTMIMIAGLIVKSDSWKYLAIGIFISTFALFAWRYTEFNSLFPNTATAKLNFSVLERIPVSLKYLGFTLFNSGLIIFLILGIAGLKLEQHFVRYASLFVIFIWIGYYMYMGGDWVFERHLIGLYFFAAALSAPLWVVASRVAKGLFIVLILTVVVISIARYGDRFDYLSPKHNDPWVMLGQAAGIDRSKYGVLITTAAGKIPFYAGGDCIDNLGLNDPYLATIKRDLFVPGHSAGDDFAAIELAKSHPAGIYSRFSYIDPNFINGPEDISLWVNNLSPQDSVQIGVTQDQWESVNEIGDPFIWSLISEPVITDP